MSCGGRHIPRYNDTNLSEQIGRLWVRIDSDPVSKEEFFARARAKMLEIQLDAHPTVVRLGGKRELAASLGGRVSEPDGADNIPTEPTPHTCAVWGRRHPNDNHARIGTTETDRYIQKPIRSTVSEEIDRRKPGEGAGCVGFGLTTSKSSI